jgi:hypothetical protein
MPTNTQIPLPIAFITLPSTEIKFEKEMLR